MDDVKEQRIACDEEGKRKVRTLLKKAIVGENFEGVVECWAESKWFSLSSLQMEPFPKSKIHNLGIASSIYSRWWPSLLNFKGLNGSIKVAGEYIGTDKLGHFFDQGYGYFKGLTNSPPRSLKKVLYQGVVDECDVNGPKYSGIFSNADLAANYSGLQFWKRVTGGDNPYFICDERGWHQNSIFHWKEYVNPAWDEGINCSIFEDYMKGVVEKNIADLEKKHEGDGKNFRCPVDKEKCQKIGALPDSEYYVHDSCNSSSKVASIQQASKDAHKTTNRSGDKQGVKKVRGMGDSNTGAAAKQSSGPNGSNGSSAR